MAHFGLKWPQYPINYLGVTPHIKPSKYKFKLFRLNLDSYCDKLAPKLNLWKIRGLILLRKIIILKSLVLPKLYYKLSILPNEIHPPFIKRLNALIMDIFGVLNENALVD